MNLDENYFKILEAKQGQKVVKMSSSAHSRFRLIDVLFVILAVALLASVLIPTILLSRESARHRECTNNLRHIALGMSNYTDTFEAFPYGTLANDRLAPEKRLSWLVGSAGFVLDGQLSYLFEYNDPWDSAINQKPRCLAGLDEEPSEDPIAQCPIFQCPANPNRTDSESLSLTSYVGLAGLGLDAPTQTTISIRSGIWGYDRQTIPSDITDGLATTLLVAETRYKNGPWTAGGFPTVRGVNDAGQSFLGKNRQFGGLHKQGCNVVFADGSVRTLNSTMDNKIFTEFATIAGNAIERDEKAELTNHQ